ncbi:MAG: BatA domain-containing protein, partial [Planctomycetota bacterium]
MGFLHPGLALAGVLLVSLPILIHLLNRRRFKIVDWAAMDLLRQAMKRNRRKLRFESWLLLLLRCLVIGLLGVAIARPLGCSNSAVARLAGQDGGLHIFILDDSGSTAHAAGDVSSFDRIQELATARLASLAAGGAQVAVLSASASESPAQRDPIA